MIGFVRLLQDPLSAPTLGRRDRCFGLRVSERKGLPIRSGHRLASDQVQAPSKLAFFFLQSAASKLRGVVRKMSAVQRADDKRFAPDRSRLSPQCLYRTGQEG